MNYIAPHTPVTPQYRCTFSLPRDLAKDISLIAKRMRMSQSALLAVLLSDPIAQLAKMAELLPPREEENSTVTSDVVRRLRGKSIDLLKSSVTEAMATARQLDPGLKFDGQD